MIKPKCFKEKKLLLAHKLSMTQTWTEEDAYDLWKKWWAEDMTFFAENSEEWDKILGWIRKCLSEHDTAYVERSICVKRNMQKRHLNKAYKRWKGYAVIAKTPLSGGKLAKYIVIIGNKKRYGDFATLMAYSKKMQKIEKTK